MESLTFDEIIDRVANHLYKKHQWIGSHSPIEIGYQNIRRISDSYWECWCEHQGDYVTGHIDYILNRLYPCNIRKYANDNQLI